MQPKYSFLSSLSGVTFLAIASFSSVQAAPFLIVGNDEKLLWDDQGKPIVSQAGKDSVANSPKLAGTVTVGKQPSGLDISKKGDLALVTNRADNSISVLTISGKDVKVTDTIPMGDSVAHVAISGDGTKALVVKPVA